MKSKFKHSIILILANILVMVAIVLFVTLFWLPRWLSDVTGHEAKVVTPDVVGVVVSDALTQLEEAGLRPMVIDTVYSDGSLPGEVIEQLPEGHLPVKPNRIVYLTINAFDVQKVIFPDVIQWSSRQTLSQLRELKFVPDSIHYVPYEFDDLVLSVTDREGREMQAGRAYPVRTHVILHVGSTSAQIEVQNDSIDEQFFE